jgi:3-hydroxyisobutyrate dehydrogenase
MAAVSTNQSTIGFIGLGNLGAPMAATLLRAGNRVKLSCNDLLAAFQGAMGEARALALGCAIDPERLFGMLAGSRSFLEGLGGYAARIARDDHDDVRFPVPMGQKDMRLVAETAGKARVPMPIARIVGGWLDEADRLGWADRDWSVLTRVPVAEAGLLAKSAA